MLFFAMVPLGLVAAQPRTEGHMSSKVPGIALEEAQHVSTRFRLQARAAADVCLESPSRRILFKYLLVKDLVCTKYCLARQLFFKEFARLVLYRWYV